MLMVVQVDDREHHPRARMPQYILDFFLEKYGLMKLAKQHVVEFVNTMRKHRAEYPRLMLMSELCGAVEDPAPHEESDFLCDLLKYIMHAAHLEKLPIQAGNSDVNFPLDQCLDAIEMAFPIQSDEHREALEENILKASTHKHGPSFISMDSYFSIMVGEFRARAAATRERLTQLFIQNDANSDGTTSCLLGCTT